MANVRSSCLRNRASVSAIALADVMYMAKDLIGMYYSTYESLFMLVVAYLVILLPDFHLRHMVGAEVRL